MTGLPFQDYLLDTLLWTAVLIAAVLVLRRPVARWFGPQIAYALWAIPALRLLLPPIELPAWMNPAPAQITQITILNPDTPVATINGPAGFGEAAPGALQSPANPVANTPVTPMTELAMGPILEAVVAVWCIGAVTFLALRFSAYFKLRKQLLDGAVDVGRDGAVRLIETPATSAPLAFGVLDKVIALPTGFLAQPDRTARDLALAHEMQHHAGRDLLINVLVQPLFALHWWNPLGRYGWMALRRDQEAACDARVIAAQPDETREAYANLIVQFATKPNAAPNYALAAPMACPVLGEKSIIHRLRSLKMNDTSLRRRMAGRVLLGGAVVALPLTATVSYAASNYEAAPTPPAPPAFSLSAPTPPAPPSLPTPPAPPEPPAPPAIASLLADQTTIVSGPETAASDGGSREDNVFVVRTVDHSSGDVQTERTSRSVFVRGDNPMTEAEIEEVMVEVREGLAEANRSLENLPQIIEEAMEGTEGQVGRTVVSMTCDSSSNEIASARELEDGSQMVMVCQTRVMAHALEGLREARSELMRSRDLSTDMRDRIVTELDQQIERWENAQS